MTVVQFTYRGDAYDFGRDLISVDLEAYPPRFYVRDYCVHVPVLDDEAIIVEPAFHDGDWDFLHIYIMELPELAG